MLAVVALVVAALLQAAPARSPADVLLDVKRLASAETNDARVDAIAAMLRERNLPFAVESFTLDAPRGREPRTVGRNLVVTLGQGGEDVVVGAHLDAARLPDGSLSRGAVDNAASSVLLVRMAEALRRERLAVRLRIVWFDMEEIGLLGSAHYAKAHASDRIRAMLNFDINAYGDTVLFGPWEQAVNASLRRSLVLTCADEGLPCVPFPQMPPGDDRSFVAANVPALSIAILPAAEAHQVWLMMNGGDAAAIESAPPPVFRTIHSPEDTPDKVDARTLSTMLRFGLSLVRRVAGA